MKTKPWHQLAVAALLVATATPAAAWHNHARTVDIEVVSDRGRHYPQVPVTGGADVHRAYLEAREGERYSIRVKNLTGARIGLVIAVDGRNIISGDASRLKSSERMYILGPWERATYEGWRTGRNRVNRFYFTDAGDSYADAFGDRSAMGVIAVAAFEAKLQPRREVYDSRNKTGSRAAPKAGADASAAPRQKGGAYESEDSAGTGFGEEHYSPSRRVSFEAQRHAAEKHFLKYEWRETLCEKGLVECHDRGNRFWPDDHRDVYGYAPYPPNRRYHHRDSY